jgi:hypothetical protein
MGNTARTVEETDMNRTKPPAARYTPKQIRRVRKHLYRITRGLFALADPDEDGDMIVLCYEGRNKPDPDCVDCRDQGILAHHALKELMKWRKNSVKAGKLGCIEDPEEGMTYTQEACYLLHDIVTEPWDNQDYGAMLSMDWAVLSGFRTVQQ